MTLLKIKLQKKTAAKGTFEVQKKSTTPAQIDEIPIQPIGKPKEKYYQKSNRKLLINSYCYNHKYL